MLLRALEHESIIRLLDVYPSQNEADLYLVFEFMDSDLHNANASNILEEEHKQYIIYQLLKALLFIHSSGVVHRDIKPENLLLNTSCQLKVADFGLARSLQTEGDASAYPMTEYIATRWYRAPEIVLGSTIYSKAVDMWAVGCIIAELYIGRPLFPGKSTVDQITRIMEITGRPTEQQIEEIFGGSSAHILLEKVNRVMTRSIESLLPNANDDAIDLIKKLLQFCPSDRLTIEQTLQHPYVSKYREPAEEMMATSIVSIPLDDNEKRSVSTYRNELFNLSRQKTVIEAPEEDVGKTRKKKSSKQIEEHVHEEEALGGETKKKKKKTSPTHEENEEPEENKVSSKKNGKGSKKNLTSSGSGASSGTKSKKKTKNGSSTKGSGKGKKKTTTKTGSSSGNTKGKKTKKGTPTSSRKKKS